MRRGPDVHRVLANQRLARLQLLADALGKTHRAELEAGIVKQRPRARARCVGADMPVDGEGRLRPVNAGGVGGNLRRIGGLAALGLRLQRASL